jgi:hypothetical protein
MLKVERSRVRLGELNEFYQFTYSFRRHKSLKFTQPLTEISTINKKIFLQSKARPLHEANNLTAFCEPIF